MAPIPTYNPVKEIKAGGSSREVAVVINEWVDICKLRQENDDEGVQALVAALLGKKAFFLWEEEDE